MAGDHLVVPLPFDPKSLRGLSERLIVSHHDNNYASAVKKLSLAERRIAQLPEDVPGFELGGLMTSLLTFLPHGLRHAGERLRRRGVGQRGLGVVNDRYERASAAG